MAETVIVIPTDDAAAESPAESAAEAHADRAESHETHAETAAVEAETAKDTTYENAEAAALAAEIAAIGASKATDAANLATSVAQSIADAFSTLPERMAAALSQQNAPAEVVTEKPKPDPNNDVAPKQGHWYYKPLFGRKNRAE